MTGKVLILDDLSTNRMLLKAKLAPSQHELQLCASPIEALDLLQRHAFDLMVLDHDMPGMTGVELCRHLRATKATARMPLLMVTSHADPALRLQALRAGADDVLHREVSPKLLRARVRNLLALSRRETALSEETSELERLSLAEPESSYEHRAVVGLIGPSRAEAIRWRNALAPHLDAQMRVLCRDTALNDMRQPPDVYLIADDLEREDRGSVLMAELRSRARRVPISVCLVLPPEPEADIAAVLDMGAEDAVLTTAAPEELALRLRRLIAQKRREEAARQRLSAGVRLALSDPLTGLANRRFALPELDRLLAQSTAAGQPCAVMVLDIDRFKRVNDDYGHGAGDAVLREIARRLRAALPHAEIIARLGGDEFMIALAGCTEAEAREMAEGLRHAIAGPPIAIPAAPGALQVTVSIGLALSSRLPEPGAALVDHADHALLGAKALGRDQIHLRRHTAA